MAQTIINRIIEFLQDHAGAIPLDTPRERKVFLEQAISEYPQISGKIGLVGHTDFFIADLVYRLREMNKEACLVAVLHAMNARIGEPYRAQGEKLSQDWAVFCETPPPAEAEPHESVDFKYHIFLSYGLSDGNEVESWVKDLFLPQLKSSLGHFLDEPPDIFDVRESATLPESIRQELVSSRCIVPIWHPSRFASSWWEDECSVMRQRESHLNKIHPPQKACLIFPVIANDCSSKPKFKETLPTQAILDKMNDFLVPASALRRSCRYFKFKKAIDHWLDLAVVRAIRNSTWRMEWLHGKGSPINSEPSSPAELSQETAEAMGWPSNG